jgi:hypothetical protein
MILLKIDRLHASLARLNGSVPLKALEGKRLAAEISKLNQPPGFTG